MLSHGAPNCLTNCAPAPPDWFEIINLAHGLTDASANCAPTKEPPRPNAFDSSAASGAKLRPAGIVHPSKRGVYSDFDCWCIAHILREFMVDLSFPCDACAVVDADRGRLTKLRLLFGRRFVSGSIAVRVCVSEIRVASVAFSICIGTGNASGRSNRVHPSVRSVSYFLSWCARVCVCVSSMLSPINYSLCVCGKRKWFVVRNLRPYVYTNRETIHLSLRTHTHKLLFAIARVFFLSSRPANNTRGRQASKNERARARARAHTKHVRLCASGILYVR